MEDEIARLYEEKPEDDVETIPRMECQAFEHHDYLVFMFHDLRDWMLVLQLLSVKEVDYSITRKTKKIGIGRVLKGDRLIQLAKRALQNEQTTTSQPAIGLAGTPASEPAPGHHEPQPATGDHQPPLIPDSNAGNS